MFDAEPEEWEQTTLGAIATLGGGTTPSKSEESFWQGGTIPWATPSDITSLQIGVSSISETGVAITERALKECSLPLNPPNTVLMTSRATIGFAALNSVPMTTNQGFITFRCGDQLDPEFLLQWLTARRSLLVAAAGGSTFKELSRGTAKLLPISLPSLGEQRRVASVLCSVDAAVAAQIAVRDQLELTFAHLVEASFSAERDWRRVPLGSACQSIQVGIVIRPASYYVEAGGIPALRSLNVGENQLYLDELVYISEDGHKLNSKSSLRPGDVVTRRTGEPGKSAVVPEGFSRGLNCIDIIFSRPRSELRPEFLSFFMNSAAAKRQVAAMQGGLAQQHLNVGEMKKLMVPLPSVDQQDEIVGTLRDAWAHVAVEAETVKRLLTMKTALAADLLSGRVRVPA